MKSVFTLATTSLLALAVTTACSAQPAPTDCRAVVAIDPETTLTQLSDFWFGDTSFRTAIMLASNARVGQDEISFISDMNNLPVGSNVCVPVTEEANTLRRRYDRYLEAVDDASMAEPSEVVNSLDPLPRTGVYTMISWIRSDQVSQYPEAPGPHEMTGDTWVTLAPHLRDFCRDYRTEVSDDPDALVVRMEQRLGLPPSSSKTHIVQFQLSPDEGGDAVFRPCGDPATDTTSCSVGFPSPCTDGCEAHRAFFLNQYYTSYGTAQPVQYPWTSLGYTFDWGPGNQRPDGTIGYEEVGESEYVIPAGTTVQFLGTVPTEQYCSVSP
ncbi:hypothetical protein NHF45_13460 [Maricaulaceae bacterium NA33B04]|nr:hypothetical protein [Maricaulaceae bacterium NA33B04]